MIHARMRHGVGYAAVLPKHIAATNVSQTSLAALGTFAVGLGGAASLALFAVGQDKAAYAFGISTAIATAFIGFVRVMSEEQ
jgi:hypothetical protein